jgi:hypothetical protein
MGKRILGVSAAIAAMAVLAACTRGPDPMSLVQSPAEFACREAVAEAAGSRRVTLLALQRTPEGATAQLRADGDGSFWVCTATEAGRITGLSRTGIASTSQAAQ